MEQINFDVQIRKTTGSARARQVRRSNLIPGIIYGGEPNLPTSRQTVNPMTAFIISMPEKA
jgi:ribosomal protein L25 (general stress protein Ctc)